MSSCRNTQQTICRLAKRGFAGLGQLGMQLIQMEGLGSEELWLVGSRTTEVAANLSKGVVACSPVGKKRTTSRKDERSEKQNSFKIWQFIRLLKRWKNELKNARLCQSITDVKYYRHWIMRRYYLVAVHDSWISLPGINDASPTWCRFSSGQLDNVGLVNLEIFFV